jgi:3,4-dihydroxy 2-butanone 4-phosphate synthase/GTP cyclohydrolase II
VFTGLVEEVGRVSSLERGEMLCLSISADRVAGDTRAGDSVSVNGACLTVDEADDYTLTFFAMPETLRRTALGTLREGSPVNLERAMAASGRFGGHIVQGHVDGVGEVLAVRPEGEAEIWEFWAPEAVLRYCVEKGSICVDGISLTVVSVGDASFTVSILPQTRANTNLGGLREGSRVNLEADVIAKYVERLLEPRVAETFLRGAQEMPFSPIEEIIEDIKLGKMVIVCDDEDRENEGDLTMAAELVTADDINFMASHGRGLICLPMAGEIVDRLEIPAMVTHNASRMGTAFTASIEAKEGITTGISAADRAHTCRVAVDDATGPEDLVMPGHVFPLRAKPGGVLQRAGQTEAAVDLARLAGMKPAGVICEIMKEDGTMARVPDLEKFSKEHDIKLVTVAQIIEYRHAYETQVRCAVETRLPTPFGEFRLRAYENEIDALTHVALVMGEPEGKDDVLVRVHSACLTGDALHSLRCDCGEQLEAAMEIIAAEGEGVIAYMQQEGRGIGLLNKMKAYHLQDEGMDTVEANQKLGLAPDLRDYGVGAQILKDLDLKRIRLLTNNLTKVVGLRGFGLEITARVPIEMEPNGHNERYLKAKREKLNHVFEKF